MDPERWRLFQRLFHSAMEREPDAREAFLAEACPDQQLREEIASLIKGHGGSGLLDSRLWPYGSVSKKAKLGAGSQLGPYKIERLLGSGGMGQVYEATDTRLGRKVAIKISDERFSDRFAREARAIAALNHPHICMLYDVGPDYLVMEYIEGSQLCGPMPVEQAVKLAIQIADALEEAHGKGILHRDLKPANILMTSKMSAKLLDFGLAKMAPKSDVTETLSGAIMGTPLYMAPEQVEGAPADRRSDVFSFGAVLYEILTGRRAFDSLAGVLRDDPKPIEAPPDLQRIVSRCLAKNPADRFQSMGEIKLALQGHFVEPAPRQPSIAVLPFVNMSPGAGDEFFSDGLTEEIINSLARVPGLKVTARTSAFAFRGQDQDIRKIAAVLNVRSVLEGSVRRTPIRIRVTAQLISAEDGYQLWSQRYDREMADVFAMQDEIAAAIAAALSLKLVDRSGAGERHVPKIAAYEAYLKARHHLWRVTPEDISSATEFYRQAIALDPEFALAYVAFADCWFGYSYSGVQSAHSTMPQAQSWARKALAIDPSLQEAHDLLCFVATVYDYDWEEAGRQFRPAPPDQQGTRFFRALYAGPYLQLVGRREEALEELRRAVELDPLHPVQRIVLAMILVQDGKLAESEVELRRILDLDPAFFWAYEVWANIHAMRGEWTEALACAGKAYSLAPWRAQTTGILSGILARTGDTIRSRELVGKLGDGKAYGAPLGLAAYSYYADDLDTCASWVEKAIEQRHPAVLASELLVLWRSIPRWPALAKMMNLPQKAH